MSLRQKAAYLNNGLDMFFGTPSRISLNFAMNEPNQPMKSQDQLQLIYQLWINSLFANILETVLRLWTFFDKNLPRFVPEFRL